MRTPRSRDTRAALALLVAVAAALAWANSPWRSTYESFWRVRVAGLDLRAWVNDGLMAVFFFVAGLEIKRALVRGHLDTVRKAVFPAVAAIGGMAVSAAIYAVINHGRAGAHGWGIPMATDVAFALGALSLTRAPQSVRVLLLTMAVVDDVATIAVLAIFYGRAIAWLPLALAAACVVAVVALRAARARNLIFYVAAGIGCWVALHRAGISPAIAGVILALLTRADALPHEREPLAQRLQQTFDPWSSFGILPLFALANAGIDFGAHASLGSRVALGVVAGRLVGKPAGIVAFAWLAERAGAHRPSGVDARHVAGIGALCGIGFAVALFIAQRSFAGALAADAKAGLFVASVASAISGIAILGRGKQAREKV